MHAGRFRVKDGARAEETGASVKRLVLMRHGKAAWPEGVPDHRRPLAPRGHEAVPRMAAHLAGQGWVPERVVVSDARRTRETYGLFAPVFPDCEGEFDNRLYDARPSEILDVVHETAETVGVLAVIGHNPGLHELAANLADRASHATEPGRRLASRFPTSSVALLEFSGRWADLGPGRARLVAFVTPRLLGGEDED